jgi:predicted ATPase/class 3 adenylate cyclase
MLENASASSRALPSGTVAFLFTDIEGSTQRWESHRDAMPAAIERHDAVLQNIVAQHGGYVFKRMGDAFCAVFRTARDAVATAYDAQHALMKEDFSAVDGLKVRMAVHVGHADERNGDYFGPSVNRVARLLAIGYGGQVLVSGATADLVQGEMPAQTGLRDLGSHRLKDLAQAEQVYQLTAPDLPQKFFTLKSLDALPNNLPLQLTSFIGRENEIKQVRMLLGAQRLVSLVGTGGVGKTRLGLQVGADLLDQFEDGVWFVELAPLSDGTLILNELAPLFGVQAAGDRPLLDALLSALRSKRALLIVDNCEHLVDPAAEIIEKILRGCSNIRVLATSREALKIAGEAVHRVASLDESAAIALFADRAKASTDAFELTPQTTITVSKICKRLDGIALAIELAAARVRALDVDELFTRLDERFRILTGGSRTALPRQQTMRALIDWSHDLLAQPEQALFRRVAVFAGGFTLDAATAICTDDELQSWDVLDLLASLVDKSLVVTEINESVSSAGKLRYRLLESTRQYAAEKLEGSGERDRLRRKHAEYFMKMAQRAEQSWGATPTRTWLAPLDPEIDNFRAALDWALAEKQDIEIGAALAAYLWPFWTENGVRNEGLRHVNAALALTESISVPITALLWLARAILNTYAWDGMRDSAAQARTTYESLGDRSGALHAQVSRAEALTRLGMLAEAEHELSTALQQLSDAQEPRWANLALCGLARNAMWAKNPELARERYAKALAAARSQGDDRIVSVVLNNLAETEFNVGNAARAIELGREVLARDRNRRDISSTSFALTNLAAYLIASNQLDEARSLAHEGLRKAVDVQLSVLIGCSVQHLATIAARRGEFERAALLLGFTETIFGPARARELTEQAEYDGLIALLKATLGEVRLNEFLRRGSETSQEQAVADALAI